jgi:hypothetical protein
MSSPYLKSSEVGDGSAEGFDDPHADSTVARATSKILFDGNRPQFAGIFPIMPP